MTLTRASRYYPFLIRVALYVYALNLFSYITADPDLWGHIRFGQEIWETLELPETDSHSFTSAGKTWINHEWLTEVLFFLIYDAFDSTGLLLFKLGVGLVVVHVLSGIALRQNSALSPVKLYTVYGVSMLLIVPVLQPAFMVRPHLMTLLGMTGLGWLLQKYRDGNTRALLWAPLLFLVWVNCHGGVVAGLGLFGVAGLIEIVRLRGRPEMRTWLWALGLSGVAVMLNPFGIHLWLFFLESLGTPRVITEWLPVPLWSTRFWEYKVIAVVFALGLLRWREQRVWEAVIILLALVYGFKHQRHTVLAVIVALPWLARTLSVWVERLNWNPRKGLPALTPLTHWVCIASFCAFIGFLAHNAWFRYQGNNYRILVDPSSYPTYGLRFMINNGIRGNILVPFDWGEYVLWKLPDSKVSIDGRFRTAYPEEAIQMNQDFFYGQGKPGWDRILKQYRIDAIITHKLEQTHVWLDRQPGLTKIYGDPLVYIYIPKTDPPSDTLKKFREGRLIQVTDAPVYEFPG